ncbi:hypothetical protein P691DRAFT_769473 [Macrolepiota fuliginosa MF-IS2]|uniref:Uncharacterized protein n=1 Tax=Macrolepiota fuliginosa MF-IS2 TaxID=1400762 RepID=A0A9P5WX84_9AGAR|nr:hypothetical protein P691DRAFT_769473 [Macrolepiota fuliginosa MF-IS2]
MSPSPDHGSPPPANTIELPPYGADALKHSLANCLADQLEDLEAHIQTLRPQVS